jgi:hypothetical protein
VVEAGGKVRQEGRPGVPIDHGPGKGVTAVLREVVPEEGLGPGEVTGSGDGDDLEVLAAPAIERCSRWEAAERALLEGREVGAGDDVPSLVITKATSPEANPATWSRASGSFSSRRKVSSIRARKVSSLGSVAPTATASHGPSMNGGEDPRLTNIRPVPSPSRTATRDVAIA